MIKFHARKPIRDFLNRVTEPPYSLTRDEEKPLFEAIMSIYEESTSTDRQRFLINDTFDLLRAFHNEDEAIREPRDAHWLAMAAIRNMIYGLIAYAYQLGVKLPDSEMQRYKELRFGYSNFADEIRAIYEPQKTPTSGTDGTRMGSNATPTPQTPPAGKETPQIAVLRPYTPKQKGRTAIPFAETIADKDSSEKEYTAKQKAIIESNIKTALANMTDPKAVIALFVVYFKNGILKQCPNYWQALSLIDIEGLKDPNEKQKHCPFGMHQRYGKLRNIYFEKDNNYLSLNGTDIKQDNEISPFVMEAEKKLKDLQAALKPKKTTTRANKKPAGTA